MKRWLEVLLLISAAPAMAQFASGPPGSLAFDQTGGIWGPLVSSSSMGAVSFTPPASALYCQFQGTATFTNSSASIAATNSFSAGAAVQFLTTGTLPTNFSTNSTYYVLSAGLSGSAFEVALTPLGTAVLAGSAGSGTQTVTASVPATSACFGGGGAGNISGTVSATHLTMGTGADTVGDSPATFDGTTFVFPNPFSVQAHSAFGVGSVVDTTPAGFGSSFAPAAIAVFEETSTSASGENGLLSGVLWNPATTATDSAIIIGAGGSAQINADSQATADLSAYGGLFDAESNGTTTALQDIEALQLYSYANGTNTVTNQNLINGDLANTAGGTTTQMLLNYETMENAGTTIHMVGEQFYLTNSGTTNTMGGVEVTHDNSGTLYDDNNGVFSSFNQSAGTSQDFLGLGTSITLTGGTMSAGWTGVEIDGADSNITVTTPGAMPYFRGIFIVPPTAPTGVIVHDIGLQISDVTEGSTDNIAIQTGLGDLDFGGAMKLTGITGHGTAGVVGVDASGNLSAQAAPTISAANMTSFPASSNNAVSGSLTYTTATSDTATVTGATSSSHCAFSPTNATAAAITVLAYISSVTTNAVTITHVATTASTGTVSIVCTKN
jgi:hypothetical protein